MATANLAASRSEGRISVWEHLREVVDPTAYCPRLRDGLVWSRLTTVHGEDYVIVQNPQAATYLRLSVEDFYVFELMDGSLTLRDLVVAYMLKFQRFALPRVARLVQDLRFNQFLVDPPYATFPQLRRRARGRSVGGFLDAFFRLVFNREFPINGIDGILEKAYRRGVWVLFTRPALMFMALIALTGVPLFIYYLFSQQYSLLLGESVEQDVASYYVAFLIIALVHELSHAFTVKAAHRVVRRGGFAIFYGLPGLFVDTQDIWMEPRGPRIAASWAGPYSGLVLTGLVGLVLTAAPDASWAPVLRLFGLAALVNNVFQLMPLIQLDGYFILMDWLEIPQLRRRALAFVQHDLLAKLRRRQPFNREERIFAVFGILAALYTTYAITLASAFWWNHASSAIQSALRVPNLASLLGLIVVLLVLIPFTLGLARRVSSLAQGALRTVRRGSGLARERWYRERVALITHVPALANLGKEQAQAVAAHIREERFAPGSAVVRQGDLGDRFYLIADGQAEVIREGPASSEVLAALGPLDYFGERALLDRTPRAATVRAVSKLRLLSLSGSEFKQSLAPYVDADAALRARLSERDDLDRVALFEQLGSREKDLLIARLRVETYLPGQVIVHEGDERGDFYCIRSGKVEVTRRDGQADASHVAVMRSGEFFGEVALLLNSSRTATVSAIDKTQLWVLGSSDFHELLGHYFNLESALADVARARLPAGQVLLDLAPPARSAWAAVGEPAPDFHLESADGQLRGLADFRGAKVWLWFSRGRSDPAGREYASRLDAALLTLEHADIRLVQIVPDPLADSIGAVPPPVGHVVLSDPAKTVYLRYELYAEATHDVQPAPPVKREAASSWLEALRQRTSDHAAHSDVGEIREGIIVIDQSGVIRARYMATPSTPLPGPEALLHGAPAVTS